MTQNAFEFAASAMIPIGQASTAGNLTFKSTATIVAKEGISMGAGAGAQKITTDVTGNDTAGMVAGMVASGVTAKGLNGIEAEANKLAKAPKGIDGVTEGAGNLAEDVGKAGKGLEGAANGAESAAEDAGKVVESGSNTKLNYVTSNGLVLETTPNKTTTVLGTYKSDTGSILDELGNVKSLDFGPRDGGFNLLNTPDELYVSPNQFWNEYNKPWLDNAIARDDIFKIAIEPTWDNLTRINMFTGKTELTGFGREYTYLKKHGYSFDAVTKTMFK